MNDHVRYGSIAVRAFAGSVERKLPNRPAPLSRLRIVLDFETTTDACQSLPFGSYRVYDDRRLLRTRT